MPSLESRKQRSAQTRTFEALLAIVVVAVALAAPKPAPTQPSQPPNSPQTLLDYLIYSGIMQYAPTHPQQLAQTLDTITDNAPWSLTAYSCKTHQKTLEAQNANLTQASAAQAVMFSPTCLVVVLQLGD